MRICDRCSAEELNNVCRLCGKGKYLREVTDSDCIYVASANVLFSRMIEDAFDDAGIKYLRKGALGSAVVLTIGGANETYLYYVMLKDFSIAKEIVSELPLDISDDELEEYVENSEE